MQVVVPNTRDGITQKHQPNKNPRKKHSYPAVFLAKNQVSQFLHSHKVCTIFVNYIRCSEGNVNEGYVAKQEAGIAI
jgi:hypothetical protein